MSEQVETVADREPEPWEYYTRYSSKMSNDEFDRLGFLNVRIDDISGLDVDLKAENEKYQQEQAKINGLLARVRAIESKLISRRKPFVEAELTNDRIIRENKRKREELERERLRLLSELAARERLLKQRKLLIESTKNKPWAKGVMKNGKFRVALPHQLEGAQRLVSAERGILADKPGLGKTLQAIITIDMLRSEGKGQKVLIFTPKPVIEDFRRAFEMWTDPTLVQTLNQTVGKGVKADILSMVAYMDQIIIITNYEVWRKDRSIHQKLIDCGFDTVILDEAHNLKDAKSKASSDVRELIYAENRCPQCGGGSFKTDLYYKWCTNCEYKQQEAGEFCSVKNVYPLTGTPILNKPGEIWPLLNLLDRDAFPSETAFRRDYLEKEFDYHTNKYIYTFGDGGAERLLKRLNMRYTGRTRDSAGVVMPPQEVKHHWLELDPEKYPRQYTFIKKLREEARLAFAPDAEITQEAVLAWYMRMRMAASWPDAIKIKGCAHDPQHWVYDEEKQKEVLRCPDPTVVFPPPGTPPIGESIILDQAFEITAEAVEDEDRIVVFSMYRGPIAELQRRCEEAGFRVAVMHGDVPQSKRQKIIDDFNINHTKVGEHKYDVLICQYGTGSVGLNFSGAHQLLMIEREWNPGKEEQAMDRIRRLDSEFETIVHVLHCKGTATDLIDAIMEQKLAIVEGFQNDVDLSQAMRDWLED